MDNGSGDYRIGCDIGGTFTDFILLDEQSGEIKLEKVLTTSGDPSDGVLQGCQNLSSQIPEIIGRTKHVIHGTTLVINAVLERSGAKTGLITTRGFRDVLEMRRYMRADMYDVFGDLPEPLVSRDLRHEVEERIYADGSVITPLNEDSVRRVLDLLTMNGVESIAVCLLHSYANGEHEHRIAEILREQYPGLDYSLSAEVLPQISEYERTSCTVLNAYVKPIVRRYLERLETRLRDSGVSEHLFLMLSGAGITSVETAKEFPVRLVESGPVAGVLAASRFGELTGARDVLSFDMGGTTAKASLIQDGQIPIASDYEIARVHRSRKGSGIPISLPTVNIIEVGTGGGSIAYIDGLGFVKVGPRSAGAEPGPACYGRGGTEPTVTDADLLLGYLDPDFFLGGTLRLDRQAAEAAIDERIARPLGMSTTDAAWGIIDVAREQMATAIRMHVAERAGDPSRTTIVASGGAGPVHALGLMRKLRAARSVFPLGAGVMSALGLLMAPASYNLVLTYKAEFSTLDLGELEEVFQGLEEEGRAILKKAEPDGVPSFARSIDMRYVGQGHDLNIILPSQMLPTVERSTVLDGFYSAYKARYGYVSTDSPVETVNLQVRATVEKESLAIKQLVPSGRPLATAKKGVREAFDPESHCFVPFTVYDRYQLEPGMSFSGPAIIEERESTVVVGCSDHVIVDDYGSLIVASS
jgi:N-methylhydantoinase A